MGRPPLGTRWGDLSPEQRAALPVGTVFAFGTSAYSLDEAGWWQLRPWTDNGIAALPDYFILIGTPDPRDSDGPVDECGGATSSCIEAGIVVGFYDVTEALQLALSEHLAAFQAECPHCHERHWVEVSHALPTGDNDHDGDVPEVVYPYGEWARRGFIAEGCVMKSRSGGPVRLYWPRTCEGAEDAPRDCLP